MTGQADKAALSPRRRHRETPDIAGAARRMVKKLGYRVATEDLDSLELLRAHEETLREAWAVAVAGLRGSGYSDREIGEQLGTSKQAVQQRWPRDPQHKEGT